MDKHLVIATAALSVALALTGCSQAPQQEPASKAEAKSEPVRPPEPVTGRSALAEMSKPARQWATDLMALSLTAGEIKEVPNADGKASLWTAVFVSPSQREARTFTYAVTNSGSTVKGVSASPAQPWTGATKSSQAFQVSDIQVNSDEAYKIASEKAADWLKNNPGKKWTIQLGSASRFPAPVWSLRWGTASAGYQAYVNAMSGRMEK